MSNANTHLYIVVAILGLKCPANRLGANRQVDHDLSRDQVTAEPIVTFNCHCRDCQKTIGGGYTPVFYDPANAFKITKGTPKYFGTTSEMMGDNCARFLSGLLFAIVWGQE